jgi:TonB family protein
METSIGTRLIPTRRSGARRWLVIASLILHAGVIGTYVVLGMMRIERLTPERSRIRVASMPRIEPGGGPENPGTRPKDPVKPPKPVPPKVIVQPTDKAPVEDKPTDDTAATDVGDDLPPGGGGGGGGIGPPSDEPGCPPNVECVIGDPDPPALVTAPKPVVVQAPTNVAPSVIGALRTDGDPQIHPPDTAQNAMIRDGKTKVFGIVQLCLDTSGRISKTKMLRSTGYPAYDSELLAGVRTWRYDPHRVNGTAMPVCSTVHFNYSIR